MPFLGAVLAPWAAARGRAAGTLVAVLAPAAALCLLLLQAPAVLDGGVIVVRQPWLPRFGLELALRLDGLGLLFALLVLAIGLLVLLYTHSYLPEDEPFGYFLALMLLFMGGMLGIVLAENRLLMAILWEITSFTSFLLIGIHQGDPAARRAALTALAITGAGGLALLGGVLLLGRVTGSFALSDVLISGDAIAAAPLALPILLLLAFAAFSKSARLPLNFCLPAGYGAAAPPVAALFAIMTKVGAYALLRLSTVVFGACGLPADRLGRHAAHRLRLTTPTASPPGSIIWRRACRRPPPCSCSPGWSRTSAGNRAATSRPVRSCTGAGCSASPSSWRRSPWSACRR
jgi:multicomponent K+:H+ antiporter subunit A